MNSDYWSIGNNKNLRVALLILAGVLALISGAALFMRSRGIDGELPLPGMRYVMLFAHFVPWVIALGFARKLRREGNGNQSGLQAAWEALVVMLVLVYIVLLNVELTLTMALKHG